MVKIVVGILLSVVVVLMVGTAAVAGTPPAGPNDDGFRASCAAHCATLFGGSGTPLYSVSQQAQAGGMAVTAQMGSCGQGAPCCNQPKWILEP